MLADRRVSGSKMDLPLFKETHLRPKGENTHQL